MEGQQPRRISSDPKVLGTLHSTAGDSPLGRLGTLHRGDWGFSIPQLHPSLPPNSLELTQSSVFGPMC